MATQTESKEDNAIKNRIRSALWGVFIADALSMPTHWYYNRDNIYKDFGKDGITKYEDAKHPHPEAFMIGEKYLPDIEMATKLNRNVDIIREQHRKFYNTTLPDPNNKIKKVTNEPEHGNSVADKKERYHYHYDLKAGDNTLNAHLCRLLLRNTVKQLSSTKRFRDNVFSEAFIDYMTTKNRTDNDVYLEIYIRRFFENYSKGNDVLNCAANQQEIWSIGSHGGVIRPLILAMINYRNTYKAVGVSIQHQMVTHRSENVSSALTYLIPMLLNILNGKKTLKEQLQDNDVLFYAKETGKTLVGQYRDAKGPGNIEKDKMYLLHTTYDVENGPIDFDKLDNEEKEEDVIRHKLGTACYPEHGLPLMFYTMVHCKFDFKTAVLLNANSGGDNVHRGAILGLLLGANIDGTDKDFEELKKGLNDYKEIEKDINGFVECICE